MTFFIHCVISIIHYTYMQTHFTEIQFSIISAGTLKCLFSAKNRKELMFIYINRQL